jgi:2-C-methyl-D-erythritol 2,4-cyclodiphosphate synthase
MIKTALGQDSHRFEKKTGDKKLVLGGVIIRGCPGLVGNSDADVVLHALTNAISGISGVNILGARSDFLCLTKGAIDSTLYIKEALETLGEYGITHISISIEAFRPKLACHIPSMKKSIAKICGVSDSDVGITATSGEQLTAFGKGEGIQVFAIVTALKNERKKAKGKIRK